jgi:YVTN family beta-propeller protein
MNIFSEAVYVLNRMSNGISVIDRATNEVVAGVTFHVNPFNSGSIICDELASPSPDDLIPPQRNNTSTYRLALEHS